MPKKPCLKVEALHRSYPAPGPNPLLVPVPLVLFLLPIGSGLVGLHLHVQQCLLGLLHHLPDPLPILRYLLLVLLQRFVVSLQVLRSKSWLKDGSSLLVLLHCDVKCLPVFVWDILALVHNVI